MLQVLYCHTRSMFLLFEYLIQVEIQAGLDAKSKHIFFGGICCLHRVKVE